VERATEIFGGVDVLVNNAGAGWFRPLASSPPEEAIGLLEVNLLGAILLTRAVLPRMLERRHGSVVSVGSLSGRVAMEPLYSASKYGLRGFSLALRRQLAGSGVSVSLVSPGNIDTAMTRHVRARLPKPELVATTIADLVTQPRREVVVPRRHYAIAWLEQMLPVMADMAHRRRHWSPVDVEEGAAWTS
jgi:NAD(P)-dependent dehydrogenase (short-subunit alcohol dehydrogenase family)